MKSSRVAAYMLLGAFLITSPLAHSQTVQHPAAPTSTVVRETVGDALMIRVRSQRIYPPL